MRRFVVEYNAQRLFRHGGRTAAARALGGTVGDGWTRATYQAKIRAIASVLAASTGGECPCLLFLVEVEESTGGVEDAVDALGVAPLEDDLVGGVLLGGDLLLADAGVPVIENLWLEDLARAGIRRFTLLAFPLKLRGSTGLPVRPVALPPAPV